METFPNGRKNVQNKNQREEHLLSKEEQKESNEDEAIEINTNQYSNNTLKKGIKKIEIEKLERIEKEEKIDNDDDQDDEEEENNELDLDKELNKPILIDIPKKDAYIKSNPKNNIKDKEEDKSCPPEKRFHHDPYLGSNPISRFFFYWAFYSLKIAGKYKHNL